MTTHRVVLRKEDRSKMNAGQNLLRFMPKGG